MTEATQQSPRRAPASTAQKVKERVPLSVLLASLIIVLLIFPVIESMPYASWLLRLGLTAILISAAVATKRRRELIWAGIVIVVIATPLSWATLFIDQPHIFLASCVLDAIFFAVMAGLIVVSVIRKHLATIQSVFGAISAYLLLGLSWAILYWGIQIAYPGSLSHNSNGPIQGAGSSTEMFEFSRCIYFSFVTMSTLGFGDMTPRVPLVQTLTWMQSVVGQFYMAVVVAWLISEIPREPGDQEDQTDRPDTTDQLE